MGRRGRGGLVRGRRPTARGPPAAAGRDEPQPAQEDQRRGRRRSTGPGTARPRAEAPAAPGAPERGRQQGRPDPDGDRRRGDDRPGSPPGRGARGERHGRHGHVREREGVGPVAARLPHAPRVLVARDGSRAARRAARARRRPTPRPRGPCARRASRRAGSACPGATAVRADLDADPVVPRGNRRRAAAARDEPGAASRTAGAGRARLIASLPCSSRMRKKRRMGPATRSLPRRAGHGHVHAGRPPRAGGRPPCAARHAAIARRVGRSHAPARPRRAPSPRPLSGSRTRTSPPARAVQLGREQTHGDHVVAPRAEGQRALPARRPGSRETRNTIARRRTARDANSSAGAIARPRARAGQRQAVAHDAQRVAGALARAARTASTSSLKATRPTLSPLRDGGEGEAGAHARRGLARGPEAEAALHRGREVEQRRAPSARARRRTSSRTDGPCGPSRSSRRSAGRRPRRTRGRCRTRCPRRGRRRRSRPPSRR